MGVLTGSSTQSGQVVFLVASSSLINKPQTLLVKLIFQKIHESLVLFWFCKTHTFFQFHKSNAEVSNRMQTMVDTLTHVTFY